MPLSCSDDEERLIDPDDGQEEELFAWIWALDDEEGVVRVYDADDGSLQGTFSAVSHPMMRQVVAGPSSEPTVWMGKDGSAYAFTRGFHPHGDHGHMEIPEALGVVATGAGNVHQGVDDHGEYVVYANDGDQTFTIIDVADLSTRTVDHGSSHSAALHSHGKLVATDMHNGWVRLIDVATNTIAAEFEIDTLAHGDAFHHDSETAFIATLNGFEVLNLEDEELAAFIAYPMASGRVNFLYHAGEVPIAFGPHKSESSSDKIVLLNMRTRTAEALTISDAELDWNIAGGNFALSEDGRFLLATDKAVGRAYLVCIDVDNAIDYKSLTTVSVPVADMACAINYAGDHIWVLDKSTGKVYCYHPGDNELHNQWQADASTDYIFVTSYSGDVLKDY
jgi:hypothetical protein